jgi:rod shape-determining protein MreD
MAKNNYEFKPDREGPDLLSRLTLTRKQRLSLLKWGLYGLVLVLLSVAQDVLLTQVRIFGATTDLVPCAIITVCVLEGAEAGCGFALTASLLYLFSGSAAGVHTVPVLTLLAISAAIFRQSYLQKGFYANLVCVSLATVLYETAMYTVALVLGQLPVERWSLGIITAALSLVTVPVLHPLFAAIGKIGGESWKE